MKRRIISLLLAALLLLALVPAALADTATGTGTAKGYGGDITVTITLEDGVITDVQAVGDDETAGIGGNIIDEWPAAFVEANGIVDTYTGATFAGVTRPGFIEAARAALEDAGVNPDDYMREVADEAPAEDEAYEADVVIVGAGGAGMTAAITAAEAGKTVILLESQPAVGGNSVKSTGGMNAAVTNYQQGNDFDEAAGVEKTLKTAAESWADNEVITALAATVQEQWDAWQANPEGYFDSTELFALDTMIGGKGINDPELVNTLVNNSAAAIDWLRSQSIDLFDVASFGGASVKRIHRPLNDEGKVVSVGAYTVPLLEEAVAARESITLMTDTMADTLLTADGVVCGVEATGKTGNSVRVLSNAVVLTTGGFGANLDMVVQYKPELEGFMTTNASGIQGQGILMAQAIGADTVDMEQIQIHPTVQSDTASLITEGLRGDGAILVNANGERFIDEVGTRDVVSAAEIAQPDSFSWLIVDQKMVDASSVIQGYIKRDLMLSGDTFEALAEALGIPADAFAATMNTWNGYVAEKNDPDFGRTSFAEPLDTAPFYAVKVTAGIHHTMGGLKIDPETHVIDTDGNVIPGLYAAGEVTGGVHGGNRLGGNAVADFVVFGRIAGAEAAAFAAEVADAMNAAA